MKQKMPHDGHPAPDEVVLPPQVVCGTDVSQVVFPPAAVPTGAPAADAPPTTSEGQHKPFQLSNSLLGLSAIQSSLRESSKQPDEASISDSGALNASHMGHPNPDTSQGHIPAESTPVLAVEPGRNIPLGSSQSLSVATTSCSASNHNFPIIKSDTIARGAAYHTYLPRAATNMYLTPSMFSSSSRLQAYLDRHSLPSKGDRGTPTQNMPESRHER